MARFKTSPPREVRAARGTITGYAYTEHAGLELREGQRVRIAVPGDPHHGQLADVTSIFFPAGRASPTAEVEVRVYGGTEKAPTTHTRVFPLAASTATLALLESRRTFTRVRGHPYIPGIDPPRAFGSRKPSTSTSRSTPHPTPKPTGGTTLMNAPTQTATTLADRIASAVADAVPTVESLRDEIRHQTGVAVEQAFNDTVVPRVEQTLDAAKAVVKEVQSTHDKLVEELATVIRTGGKPVAAAARAVMRRNVVNTEEGNAKDRNIIVDALSKFYSPGREAPANVLLASPPSFGKSYSIRLLGEDYDVFLEHGCSDDMDEISTLLGSPVPDGHGGFIVVDGVLTEAVRAAAAGKTVLLLLDEVLRLTPRAQEWLLTFLTGVKNHDGTRFYRLRTRRALANGTLEVIECPTTNLHIVAATNLSILNPIEAFWSRWETVRVEFTLEQAQATAMSILDSYGVDDADRKLAKTWALIVQESRGRYAKGELRFPVDFRILERAAAMVGATTSGEVARFVMDRLSDNVANWNPDTGDMAPEGKAVVVAWQKRLETLANDDATERKKKAAAEKKAKREAEAGAMTATAGEFLADEDEDTFEQDMAMEQDPTTEE